MSNMTGLGRYQKGKELEKEGLSGAQIATRLGYKDAQAWYTAKNYYGKNTAAFNARAAETSTKTVPKPEVEPVDEQISAQLLAATKAMLKSEKPKLKISVETKAEGESFDYILHENCLSIFKKGAAYPGLKLPQEDALTMLEELKELLKA